MHKALWLRHACFAAATVVGLTVAVPAGHSKPDGANEFPLLGLFRLIAAQGAAAWERPLTPIQQTGGPVKVTDPVPASATTANGGSGRSPGKAPGELGEYVRPTVRKAAASTTGSAVTGFVEETSRKVPAAATKTSDLYRNADGTYTRQVSTQPINYKAADGTWQPIDPTLARHGDRLRAKASGVQVSLTTNPRRTWGAGVAEPAPTGLADVILPTGETFGYDLQGADAVEPVVNGTTAIYKEMLPHTDVELVAFGSGLKETLVLHSRQAASSWVFPLRLKGLTAQMQKDGSIWLLDKAGNTAARIPQGHMEDSKFLDNDGDFVKSDAVAYELVKLPGGEQGLKVTADRDWLDDPARVYPVRIDPTTTVSTDGDVNIDPNPNTHAADQNGTSIAVGWDGDRVGSPLRNDVKVSFLSFGDFAAATPEHPSLQGMRIHSAWLNLYHTWTPSSYCNTYRPISVHPVAGPWTVAGLQDASVGPSIYSSMGDMLITNNTPACTNTSANRSVGRWVTISFQDLGSSIPGRTTSRPTMGSP